MSNVARAEPEGDATDALNEHPPRWSPEVRGKELRRRLRNSLADKSLVADVPAKRCFWADLPY
jgi:hypothetical protein